MTDGFPVPGEIFEGRYRISALIGSGGFARVYSAVQEDLGREVAIKILMPGTTSDGTQYSEKLVRRFNQEARLVSRLRDPHTITMFDYGETDSGLLYMVFEYIEGRSLSQIVHEDGALAPFRVVKVLEATLSSLHEAHAFGVLHRDIKPGNIMLFDYLSRPDQVKVLDFGIAKSLGDKVPGKDITADGALVGTPRYMSPEQIRGQEMGSASDLYSLGLVAFEMLAGYKAIDSNSSVTIIGLQLDTQPFQLPESLEVPDGLRTIVNKMLAKDRSQRYETAEEVLEAIELWKSGKELPAPDDDLPELSVVPVEPDPDHTVIDEPTPKRSRVIAIAVACLFLTGAIVAMLTFGSEAEPTAEELPETDVAARSAQDGAAATQDEAATGAEAEANAETSPGAAAPELKSVLIATTPRVAQISIDGEAVGESPVQAEVDADAFPIEIVATVGEHSLKTTMEAFRDEIVLDVEGLVEKSKVAEQADRKEPTGETKTPPKVSEPRREVVRSPRPTPRKSTKKPAREPEKKKPTTGLSIPALD